MNKNSKIVLICLVVTALALGLIMVTLVTGSKTQKIEGIGTAEQQEAAEELREEFNMAPPRMKVK